MEISGTFLFVLFLPAFCLLFGNNIIIPFFLFSFFVLGSIVIMQSSGGHKSYGEYFLLALQTFLVIILWYVI